MIVIFQIVLHTIFIFQFLLTVTFCLKSQNSFFPMFHIFRFPSTLTLHTEIPLTFLLHVFYFSFYFKCFFPPFTAFSSPCSFLSTVLSTWTSLLAFYLHFLFFSSAFRFFILVKPTSFLFHFFYTFNFLSHLFTSPSFFLHFLFANMHIWCSSGLIDFFTRCISCFFFPCFLWTEFDSLFAVLASFRFVVSFFLLSLDWICFFICCTSQFYFCRFFFHYLLGQNLFLYII